MERSLDNVAMLVVLNISQLTFRKYDKKISKEVDVIHSTQDAGRYNKIIINQNRIKDIQQASSAARIFHYENTVPWADNHERLLPSKNYMTYIKKMMDFKNVFQAYVDYFIEHYESFKEESRRMLNGMYREADYPSISDIPGKYGFDFYVTPLPSSNDIRLDLRSSEIEKIKNDVEERLVQSQQKAMKDLWSRLHGTVKKIVERLSDEDAKFKDSLIGNVVELTSLLPRLNVMDDSHLEDMRREVEQAICSLQPENLRSNAPLRKGTAKKAEELMKKMEGYL